MKNSIKWIFSRLIWQSRDYNETLSRKRQFWSNEKKESLLHEINDALRKQHYHSEYGTSNGIHQEKCLQTEI
jgi:hypothetical protein